MIVSFSVSNFRSFDSEQTLSLVASNRFGDRHANHAVPLPSSSERVLKTAAVYGANGAGKSNLFKGLQFLQDLVTEDAPLGSGTRREFFQLADRKGEPSSFDLQFVADGATYQYGVSLDDVRIREEWLIRIADGKHKTLYERVTNDQDSVIVELQDAPGASDRLKALSKVGGAPNRTFLSTIRTTLTKKEDQGTGIAAVLDWFSSSLVLVGPTDRFAALGSYIYSDDRFRQFAGGFLRSVATGVDKLTVNKQTLTEDELRTLLPPAVATRVLEEPRSERRDHPILQVLLGGDKELIAEPEGPNRFSLVRVEAGHSTRDGHEVRLDLREESDGTQRLLNLVPALFHTKDEDTVFFIDEIDRSLHPLLVREFVKFFTENCSGGLQQLIFTTHESSLLDQDLLRRDEIWFVEKDVDGATHLYSLADYKVRADLELRKHYLQGRFGAVPFVGGLDKVLAGGLQEE